ncbi:MAG: hypothetical protein ABH870_04175 [bacterium]
MIGKLKMQGIYVSHLGGNGQPQEESISDRIVPTTTTIIQQFS